MIVLPSLTAYSKTLSPKKKIRFIVNPVSGFGKQKLIEKLVPLHLNLNKYEYSIVYTQAAKHATELARNAVDQQIDIVVAVGGDGSINEISKALIGSNCTLAIVPVGSGNGFARHLGIPLNVKRAIEVINKGSHKKVDTVQINHEHFVNVAGLGFDAFIGTKIAKLPKRGFSAYFKLIAQEFYKFKDLPFELLVDGKTITKNAFLICFANGPQWGYNAHISPTANNTDGLLDIAILKNINALNIIPLSIKLLNKSLHKSNHLEVIRVKEVQIKQRDTIAHIDGEPIEVGDMVSVKVLPLSLNVIVP